MWIVFYDDFETCYCLTKGANCGFVTNYGFYEADYGLYEANYGPYEGKDVI